MGKSLYFSTTTNNTIDIHEQFDYLAQLGSKVVVKDIPALLAYKYQGDFHGLLSELGIPKDLHIITTVLNGYDSSLKYSGEKTSISIIEDGAARALLEYISM